MQYYCLMGRFNVADSAHLIRSARIDAGLTQVALAELAGITQPTLAQIESGRRSVSEEMLIRLLECADYRPSIPLSKYAPRIRELALARGLTNVRVFGSTATGDDHFSSDIDLVATPSERSDLLDYALFSDDVAALTGFSCETYSDRQTPHHMVDAISGAVPL